MGIHGMRDPRDLLPSILAPRENTPALAETAWVHRELGDDGLRVMFNHQRQKFVVMDTKAPGGPSSAYVMIVQNEDGSFRPFDERTIQTLRRNFLHHDGIDELARLEIARERRNKSRIESLSSAFADDFKWFGKAVTTSTGWRDRSAAREEIRKEAGR